MLFYCKIHTFPWFAKNILQFHNNKKFYVWPINFVLTQKKPENKLLWMVWSPIIAITSACTWSTISQTGSIDVDIGVIVRTTSVRVGIATVIITIAAHGFVFQSRYFRKKKIINQYFFTLFRMCKYNLRLNALNIQLLLRRSQIVPRLLSLIFDFIWQ